MFGEQLNPAPGSGEQDKDKPSPSGTPAPGPGEAGKPGGQAGEVDISKLSDEELQKLILDEEAENLAKIGLGKFKSYEELGKGYKALESEGSVVLNDIKEVATQYGMTPKDFAQYLKGQGKGAKPGEGKPAGEKPEASKEIAEVRSLIGRTNLDRMFDKFQLRMEKDGTDILDSLQAMLEGLIPGVIQTVVKKCESEGKSKEEIQQVLANLNPFAEAYDLHLWQLQKGGNVENLKDQISALDAATERKRRQLKIQSGGKSGKLTPQQREGAAAFGFDD